ncbi:MAG: glycosyltransferase family 2 protein [Thermoguttaceae bacterium]
MSRLSIIIPYGGNSKRLEDTLVSVLENRPPECEVLVLLSQPYENPYHLDDEVCFRRVADGAGLVEATNQGIQLSRAPIVHLLACGTEVREGWADSAVEHFQDPRVAAVAPLAIDLNHRDRVLAAGIRYTSAGRIHLCRRGCDVATLAAEADQVLAPYPAAAFYRKKILESLGGLSSEAGDRLAILDLGLTLRHLGFHTVFEPRSTVAASPEHQPRAGAFQGALESERFFWRWGPLVADCSPAMHLLAAAGECVRGLVNLTVFAQVAGRLAGIASAGSGRQREYLRQLQERWQPASASHPSGPHSHNGGMAASSLHPEAQRPTGS